MDCYKWGKGVLFKYEFHMFSEYFYTCVCVRRVEGLQMHYDLEVCHLGASTEVNERRAQRKQWQRKLNTHILNITLELIVNIFRSA